MDELAAKKAEKAEDNRLWSPIDALEYTITRLKNKDLSKIHLCIHWREDVEGGGKIHWAASNITRPDHIALLEMSKFEQCSDWFTE